MGSEYRYSSVFTETEKVLRCFHGIGEGFQLLHRDRRIYSSEFTGLREGTPLCSRDRSRYLAIFTGSKKVHSCFHRIVEVTPLFSRDRSKFCIYEIGVDNPLDLFPSLTQVCKLITPYLYGRKYCFWMR